MDALFQDQDIYDTHRYTTAPTAIAIQDRTTPLTSLELLAASSSPLPDSTPFSNTDGSYHELLRIVRASAPTNQAPPPATPAVTSPHRVQRGAAPVATAAAAATVAALKRHRALPMVSSEAGAVKVDSGCAKPKPKRHECFECGKRFTKLCDLKAHKRKHTGEKPYHCLICGRFFAWRSSLKSHIDTHSGVSQAAAMQVVQASDRDAGVANPNTVPVPASPPRSSQETVLPTLQPPSRPTHLSPMNSPVSFMAKCASRMHRNVDDASSSLASTSSTVSGSSSCDPDKWQTMTIDLDLTPRNTPCCTPDSKCDHGDVGASHRCGSRTEDTAFPCKETLVSKKETEDAILSLSFPGLVPTPDVPVPRQNQAANSGWSARIEQPVPWSSTLFDAPARGVEFIDWMA